MEFRLEGVSLVVLKHLKTGTILQKVICLPSPASVFQHYTAKYVIDIPEDSPFYGNHPDLIWMIEKGETGRLVRHAKDMESSILALEHHMRKTVKVTKVLYPV